MDIANRADNLGSGFRLIGCGNPGIRRARLWHMRFGRGINDWTARQFRIAGVGPHRRFTGERRISRIWVDVRGIGHLVDRSVHLDEPDYLENLRRSPWRQMELAG